jgi:hypothetical protein
MSTQIDSIQIFNPTDQPGVLTVRRFPSGALELRLGVSPRQGVAPGYTVWNGMHHDDPLIGDPDHDFLWCHDAGLDVRVNWSEV